MFTWRRRPRLFPWLPCTRAYSRAISAGPYYTARTSLNTLALLDPLTDDEVREGGSNSL